MHRTILHTAYETCLGQASSGQEAMTGVKRAAFGMESRCLAGTAGSHGEGSARVNPLSPMRRYRSCSRGSWNHWSKRSGDCSHASRDRRSSGAEVARILTCNSVGRISALPRAYSRSIRAGRSRVRSSRFRSHRIGTRLRRIFLHRRHQFILPATTLEHGDKKTRNACERRSAGSWIESLYPL